MDNRRLDGYRSYYLGTFVAERGKTAVIFVISDLELFRLSAVFANQKIQLQKSKITPSLEGFCFFLLPQNYF